MKLKTNTMVLAIAAFLVAGGATYWEVSKTNRPSEDIQQLTQNQLFNFNENDVAFLEVSPNPENTLSFQKTEAKYPETWQMKLPEKKIADEAAITFLLDQLVSSKTEKTVTINKTEWPDFGISPDNPRATITLENGTTHHLLLGGETFDQQNLYAVVDQALPLPDDVTVSIVSTTLLDALQRPIQEWEYDPNDLPSVPATPKAKDAAPAPRTTPTTPNTN